MRASIYDAERAALMAIFDTLKLRNVSGPDEENGATEAAPV